MMETNKYIIELEEMIVSTADGQMPLYKIKGFNTPIFDSAGVSKLTPYTELDVEAIRDEAYDKGLNDGWTNVHNECEAAYQNGLYNAWDVARKIMLSEADGGIQWKLKEQWFGKFTIYDIFKDVPAMEVIEKIRQYGQEQEDAEFHVGDEFVTKNNKDFGVIVAANAKRVLVLWKDDADIVDENNREFTTKWAKERFSKTGRNFPEIAEVFKKMQEVRE